MKTSNLMLSMAFIGLVMAACEKQTTPKPLDIQKVEHKSDAYYAKLRAFKNSDHQVSFGWFGGSGGEGGTASMQNRWLGLPDSLDIVSLWGGMPVEGSAQMEEMRFCQQVKGMKVLRVSFADDKLIENYSKDDQGIEALAADIIKDITDNQIEGFDIDYEPNVGGGSWTFFRNKSNMTKLLKALSKGLGPKSGTGKILAVDGEVNYLEAETFEYLDYAIAQAYASSSPAGLQYRFNQLAGCPPEKFIVTENFESYWREGGVSYNDPEMGTIPSLLGMAYWQPEEGKKAGSGSYHIEYDYANATEPYYYTRRSIQIMNPAKP